MCNFAKSIVPCGLYTGRRPQLAFFAEIKSCPTTLDIGRVRCELPRLEVSTWATWEVPKLAPVSCYRYHANLGKFLKCTVQVISAIFMGSVGQIYFDINLGSPGDPQPYVVGATAYDCLDVLEVPSVALSIDFIIR